MKVGQRVAAILATSALSIGALVAATGVAEAAAYPIGVYAPNKVDASHMEGWANLSRDCSETVGCYNYIKIEKSNWYGPSYVNGWWATDNGWNSITADLPEGCGDYRTTTDSYNDIAGGVGAGTNVGQVGVSENGTEVDRYHLDPWSSGWVHLCR